MQRVLRHSPAFALVLVSFIARAQPSPGAPPPSGADEDLEVPAAAPSAGAAQPPAAPTPASPPLAVPATPNSPPSAATAASPSPATAVSPAAVADTERMQVLERRLAALEERARLAAIREVKERADERRNAIFLEGSGYSPSAREGFALGGYVQADYLHSQASEDQLAQSGAPLNLNRFYVRRARFRADRGWKYAAVTFELDANTVSGVDVGIRLAEAALFYRGHNRQEIPPLVMLTAGITDLPFGFELLEADRTRVFMERSLASSALFPTKQDAALKVTGAAAFLRYAVALSNGEPVDSHGLPRDPNSAKDVTGRFGAAVKATDAFEITVGTSFATGKGFHPGSPATKGTLTWQDQNENGIAESNEVSGKPGSAATPSKNFDRWAFGLDLGARLRTKLGDTRLYGELYASKNYDRGFLPSDPLSTTSGGIDVRQLGGYVALTQDITAYGVAGLRYSVYDPNADVFEQRRGDFQPRTQTVQTFSPVVGVALPAHARLMFEYDFVHDYLGRTASGVPTDAKNDTWTVRLQGNL